MLHLSLLSRTNKVYNLYMPFLQPEAAVNALDLLPGMQVADFGCGPGHWTLALADKIGRSGKLFAFDIQPSVLEAVRSQAKQRHIQNIEAVQADLEAVDGSKLKDGILDFVLIANILIQAEKPEQVIKEALRILKKNGRCAVIEWDSEGVYAGPPAASRISRQKTEALFRDAGFRFDKEFSAGSHHYGLIFKNLA